MEPHEHEAHETGEEVPDDPFEEMKPERIQFWERLIGIARDVLDLAEAYLRTR